jgi:RNA-directed DNA polymerase
VKYERRKSDSPIVPEKRPNKAETVVKAEEVVEGRGLAKGNLAEQTRGRTQSRAPLPSALDRVRLAARRYRKEKLTALWHHVYSLDHLRGCFYSLNRKSSPGIDGKTWYDYRENLEENLQDLSARLKRGAYRAKPVERVYIPKADGRQRPIGKPTLEDKIVQRATVEVLEAVYESEFKRFSYGFTRGKSQHDALDALTVAIERRKVSWVLDADIRGFFDAIDHEWLIRFIEHRIVDKRVIRHIKKWLKAGVLEEGEFSQQEEGTPQGGSISPMLANIYLHYVLDLWVDKWRRQEARGDVIIVRYADDLILGFQYKEEAERFHEMLQSRLKRFNLYLNQEKTRLIEFGRFAVSNRKRRGLGKPETFDFLGFTHMCSKTRNGKFTVRRQTIAKRMRQKLREIKRLLRIRINWPIWKVGNWLKSVLTGHYRYFGVPRNFAMLAVFRRTVVRQWYTTLMRRSHKHKITWKRMYIIADQWLPEPCIYHPYPSERLVV